MENNTSVLICITNYGASNNMDMKFFSDFVTELQNKYPDNELIISNEWQDSMLSHFKFNDYPNNTLDASFVYFDSLSNGSKFSEHLQTLNYDDVLALDKLVETNVKLVQQSYSRFYDTELENLTILEAFNAIRFNNPTLGGKEDNYVANVMVKLINKNYNNDFSIVKAFKEFVYSDLDVLNAENYINLRHYLLYLCLFQSGNPLLSIENNPLYKLGFEAGIQIFRANTVADLKSEIEFYNLANKQALSVINDNDSLAYNIGVLDGRYNWNK